MSNDWYTLNSVVIMAITDQDLYKLLLADQIISETDLRAAMQTATAEKTSLYEILLKKDLVTDAHLGELIADYLKLPFVSLTKIAISDELLNIVPQSIAEKQNTIVFAQTSDAIKIASSNPRNQEFENLISKKSGKKIETYFATPQDIKDSFALYKKAIQKTFDELLKQQGDSPIAQMVDTVIEYAYENKASDIHIEPEEANSLIRFRIDGILHDELKLPRNLHEQITTRVKVLSKLRTDEHLSAQDGKMQIQLAEEKIDVRVSIVPIVDGEKIVLRLLTSKYRQFGLTDLGMSEEDMKKVKRGFGKPFGMILSTGPTGSGKTTSIYAILKILNTTEKNIATIEDPVEYEIDRINQIQVNPKTNLTFAEGLRSILRQDPDIIYVGEIRDGETADIAINSAMTGHLVLTTLHTNDAATTLPRLIDMGIEPFLVASTINTIIAQRLVRKICDKCKVSFTQNASGLGKLISADMIKKHLGTTKTLRLYRGKGCDVCHLTGYTGRVGIFEILEITPGIQELITRKADSDTITRDAVKAGMKTMIEDGLDKVQLGVTTIEEVFRVTQEI